MKKAVIVAQNGVIKLAESDERNSVYLKIRKVNMTEETHEEISLQSKTDSIDDLIIKAKQALK